MNDIMTSREVVRRCIEFRDPPRIGLHFQTDPIQGRTWEHAARCNLDAMVDATTRCGHTAQLSTWSEIAMLLTAHELPSAGTRAKKHGV